MKPIEALNHVNELLGGLMVSQTFFTACKLGLFDLLSPKPATSEELAPKLGIHPEACRRFLAALKVLGLLKTENGRYQNSDVGEFLASKSDVALEPLSQWADFYHMWEFLPEALKELKPQWQRAYGTSSNQAFAALYEDLGKLKRFAGNMNAYSAPQGQEVAERFDFSGRKCVLDVAGGSGGLAIQLGLRHRHLRGIIMDLPKVCKVADEYIAAAGLSDRFKSASADLFEGPYPSGADVITLSWILHDWNDENCARILRNCYSALPSGGALLVTESVLNEDHTGSRFAVLMSLHMLVVTEPGARERTESEYRRMLEEAGFRKVEVIRFGAPRDLIVAHKP